MPASRRYGWSSSLPTPTPSSPLLSRGADRQIWSCRLRLEALQTSAGSCSRMSLVWTGPSASSGPQRYGPSLLATSPAFEEVENLPLNGRAYADLAATVTASSRSLISSLPEASPALSRKTQSLMRVSRSLVQLTVRFLPDVRPGCSHVTEGTLSFTPLRGSLEPPRNDTHIRTGTVTRTWMNFPKSLDAQSLLTGEALLVLVHCGHTLATLAPAGWDRYEEGIKGLLSHGTCSG